MNSAQAKKEARLVATTMIYQFLGTQGASELTANKADNERITKAMRELCWMILNPTTSVNLMPDDYGKPGVCRPYRVKRS